MAISWMQKHKKWLIVTIWISTIAFVGAGFVGWGSYNYGKSDGTVAVVGDKEVPLADLQNEYSALYSQYQNMFGGKFTGEMAKQMGLEQAALQRIINKYLVLNYADELGLMITDNEVAKELVKIEAFFKDGKFDKDTYLNVLKQNRRTAAEFETQLKQDLLVVKIQNIFNLQLTNNEIANLGTLLFAQDKVSIKVIDSTSINVIPKLEELKEFYEKHKENYKSPQGYEISYTKIKNIEGKESKEMKKIALKEYLDLKKGKSNFETKSTIYDNSDLVNKEDLEKIIKVDDSKILKPILKDNNYYIIKKEKTIKPQVLPYEKVMSQINKEFIQTKKGELLNKKAKEIAENFKGGKAIGYISRNQNINIKGLNNNQTATLTQHIFNSTKPINFVDVGNGKTIVYKIEETKLLPHDDKNNNLIISTLNSYKSGSISNALLEKLQNKYSVKSYMEE